MALTFVKKAAPEQTQEVQSVATQEVHNPSLMTDQEVVTEDQGLVNEWVLIHREFEQEGVNAKIKKMEDIKKHFAAKAKEFPADQEVVFQGTEGRKVVFSKASNETVIKDKQGIILKLGQMQFNELAKIGITDLKKYLSPIELASYVENGVGSRKVSSIESGQ